MNGLLELNRRISAEPSFDFNQPQFFSLTVNNVFTSMNVHWLSHSADNGSVCYHMGKLSRHFLDQPDGLKAVHPIVKNVLDYAVSGRLPKIRQALDIYKQNFVVEREKEAVHGRDSASESQAEEQQISPRQSGVNVRRSRRRNAKRRKLGQHPAQEDIEGSIDGPVEQLQRRAKRGKLGHPAQEDIEGSVDGPVELLQRRAKRGKLGHPA